MEIKVIAQAKKNFRDYRIIDRFTAGIVLTGNEIKSLRNYQSSISEAYILPQKGELYVSNMHIAAYKYSHAISIRMLVAEKKLSIPEEKEKYF
jgi:SsrA-binding protein